MEFLNFAFIMANSFEFKEVALLNFIHFMVILIMVNQFMMAKVILVILVNPIMVIINFELTIIIIDLFN